MPIIKKLNFCHLHMLVKSMGIKRKASMTWVEYYVASARMSRKMLYDNDLQLVGDIVALRQWSWCGHVARMQNDSKIKQISFYFGEDTRAVAQQQHQPFFASRGRPPILWDTHIKNFINYIKPDTWWWDFAADRDAWKQHAQEFVNWFRTDFVKISWRKNFGDDVSVEDLDITYNDKLDPKDFDVDEDVQKDKELARKRTRSMPVWEWLARSGVLQADLKRRTVARENKEFKALVDIDKFGRVLCQASPFSSSEQQNLRRFNDRAHLGPVKN